MGGVAKGQIISEQKCGLKFSKYATIFFFKYTINLLMITDDLRWCTVLVRKKHNYHISLNNVPP